MAERTPKKLRNEDCLNFVATPMSMPLFMVSRNRIRADSLDRVKRQFQLAGKHYNKECQNENRGMGYSVGTLNKFRHLTGTDKLIPKPYPEKRPLRQKRDLTTNRDWQMAPNRYGVPPEPFLSRMGSKGTAFPKQHTQRPRISKKYPQYAFYEIPTGFDKISSSENRHKGVFLSNARERRPTTRIMVSNLNSCWRDPTDPGPCDTHTRRHELRANLVPIKKTPRPNPHQFLRYSCVPAQPNNLIPPNISFEPGPGRYETRFSNVCPCQTGKINMPGLQLKIDAQKRLKFRRLPFKRINPKQYCDPDWRHVPGAGHEHIFKMGKRDLPKPKPKGVDAKKRPEKHLNLFADGKYLNMLNNPRHLKISRRDYPLPPQVPKIVYNCVAKRIARKQLRNNKKIAFNSGQERWKDGDRPLQLTVAQIEAIKESLPPERRLVDHPINLRSSRIFSKLFHVPEHQKVTYLPKLRKRLFKFLPIPGARVLVTDSDIRPDLVFDPEHPTGMYRKKLDEKQFFLDSVLAQDHTESKDEIEVQPSSVSIIGHRHSADGSGSNVIKKKSLVTLVIPAEDADNQAVTETTKTADGHDASPTVVTTETAADTTVGEHRVIVAVAEVDHESAHIAGHGSTHEPAYVTAHGSTHGSGHGSTHGPAPGSTHAFAHEHAQEFAAEG